MSLWHCPDQHPSQIHVQGIPKSSSQNRSANRTNTLLNSPMPSRFRLRSLRSGNGGVNVILPDCSTPVMNGVGSQLMHLLPLQSDSQNSRSIRQGAWIILSIQLSPIHVYPHCLHPLSALRRKHCLQREAFDPRWVRGEGHRNSTFSSPALQMVYSEAQRRLDCTGQNTNSRRAGIYIPVASREGDRSERSLGRPSRYR